MKPKHSQGRGPSRSSSQSHSQRSYEPPTCPKTAEKSWTATIQLAPGVRGFAYEENGEIFVPLIVAEAEGSGDVGRFLDALAPMCVVTNVTSEMLRGMLRRRGFQRTYNQDHEDEWRRPI